MGSKAAMLSDTLGALLLSEAAGAGRFVDLFTGSAAVSHFVASRVPVPVLSVDLQEYSRVMAAAVTARTSPMAVSDPIRRWLDRAQLDGEKRPTVSSTALTAADVADMREVAATDPAAGFITRHYGGHYLSLRQAAALDSLYAHLPTEEPLRSLCLATAIDVASRVVAAPGHTAQPFQPTDRLLPFIANAWSRDVVRLCEETVAAMGQRHAKVAGEARAGEATAVASTLTNEDLVFCDPPYSAAQYSRFYHVLEAIARGGWDSVSGAGRAPAGADRATSDFSMRSRASKAMSSLLAAVHSRGARMIVTFPDTEASNGLSAQQIEELARKYFAVETLYVTTRHSTLGGNGSTTRVARREVKEAVMVMAPLTGKST
jgi:16S rRNA G966 N2-methylase RsmD